MFSYFSDFYFTNFLFILVLVAGVSVGVAKYKQIGNLRVFLFYCIAALLQTVLAICIVLFELEDRFGVLIENSINLFMLMEFIVFYYYFTIIIRSKNMKFVLVVLAVGFCTLTFYRWLSNNEFAKTPDRLTVIEALLLIVPALFYFYELFLFPPVKQLAKEASFWVVTGVFIFICTIIPLYLVKENLNNNYYYLYTSFYSINYISYSILFACLLNAYLCQIRIAKS